MYNNVLNFSVTLGTMVNSLYEMDLQGFMAVYSSFLDMIFVLMNTTTMTPCRHASERELGI